MEHGGDTDPDYPVLNVHMSERAPLLAFRVARIMFKLCNDTFQHQTAWSLSDWGAR